MRKFGWFDIFPYICTWKRIFARDKTLASHPCALIYLLFPSAKIERFLNTHKHI